MDMYRTIILEHSKHPHNKGTLQAPDVRYKEKNPLCGDEIQIDCVIDASGKIKEIMFDGHGCAISQATASLLTDNVKGLSIDEIIALKKQDVLDMLGIELAFMRIKCAMLSLHILQKGILQFKAKKML